MNSPRWKRCGCSNTLARTNRLFYLHPGYGFIFERFYLVPARAIYEMKLRDERSHGIPPLTAPAPEANETFWTGAWQRELAPLTANPLATKRLAENDSTRWPHPCAIASAPSTGRMVFALAGRLGHGPATAKPVVRSPASFRAGAATECQQYFGANQSGLQHQPPVRLQSGTCRCRTRSPANWGASST